jgi:nitrogen fixation protein FixH
MAAERDSLRWPVALALALAAGLSAPIAFLWIATHRPPEVLPVNTWAASNEWNAAQRAQELAHERGWGIDLRAERRSDGVRVEIRPTSSGAPLPESLDVRLRRERPERIDFDADVALEPSGDLWTAMIPLPLAGRWILVARAGDDAAWVEREFALEVTP